MTAHAGSIIYKKTTVVRYVPLILALNLNRCDRKFIFESHFACALEEFAM